MTGVTAVTIEAGPGGDTAVSLFDSGGNLINDVLMPSYSKETFFLAPGHRILITANSPLPLAA